MPEMPLKGVLAAMGCRWWGLGKASNLFCGKTAAVEQEQGTKPQPGSACASPMHWGVCWCACDCVCACCVWGCDWTTACISFLCLHLWFVHKYKHVTLCVCVCVGVCAQLCGYASVCASVCMQEFAHACTLGVCCAHTCSVHAGGVYTRVHGCACRWGICAGMHMHACVHASGVKHAHTCVCKPQGMRVCAPCECSWVHMFRGEHAHMRASPSAVSVHVCTSSKGCLRTYRDVCPSLACAHMCIHVRVHVSRGAHGMLQGAAGVAQTVPRVSRAGRSVADPIRTERGRSEPSGADPTRRGRAEGAEPSRAGPMGAERGRSCRGRWPPASPFS